MASDAPRNVEAELITMVRTLGEDCAERVFQAFDREQVADEGAVAIDHLVSQVHDLLRVTRHDTTVLGAMAKVSTARGFYERLDNLMQVEPGS